MKWAKNSPLLLLMNVDEYFGPYLEAQAVDIFSTLDLVASSTHSAPGCAEGQVQCSRRLGTSGEKTMPKVWCKNAWCPTVFGGLPTSVYKNMICVFEKHTKDFEAHGDVFLTFFWSHLSSFCIWHMEGAGSPLFWTAHKTVGLLLTSQDVQRVFLMFLVIVKIRKDPLLCFFYFGIPGNTQTTYAQYRVTPKKSKKRKSMWVQSFHSMPSWTEIDARAGARKLSPFGARCYKISWGALRN